MAAQRVAEDVAKGTKQTARVRVAVRLRPYMHMQDPKGEGACVRRLDTETLEIINWRNATETLQYQSVAFCLKQYQPLVITCQFILILDKKNLKMWLNIGVFGDQMDHLFVCVWGGGTKYHRQQTVP